MQRLIAFTLLFLTLVAWHQHGLAEELASGEQPDIVIREEDDKTFYEYRVNGVLKEIKVVPNTGTEYYLVPADGEGWIREETSTLLVPKWVLLEW